MYVVVAVLCCSLKCLVALQQVLCDSTLFTNLHTYMKIPKIVQQHLEREYWKKMLLVRVATYVRNLHEDKVYHFFLKLTFEHHVNVKVGHGAAL